MTNAGRGADRDVVVDPYLGTVVNIVRSRQGRPNLPEGCPFCVGGLEAPEPYDVRAFPNRWPALGDGRCEVVLYTPDHEASLSSIGATGVRRVIDLWAERTAAMWQRDDVEFVLVFENRGAEVGATIPHPHGQIYGYDHVPSRPAARLRAGWRPDTAAGDRLVVGRDDWCAVAVAAPVYPISLSVFPTEQVADLPSMSGAQRDGLAEVLVDVLARLDRFYDRPLPYMMWVNQGPQPGTRSARDSVSPGGHWLDVEIVSPWRAPGVSRYIAAAEVACDEYFNPLDPSEVASRLRTP
ncbi:MAG: DUF4931 domain-containing protein [Ilumatobacteraceae bacterium]